MQVLRALINILNVHLRASPPASAPQLLVETVLALSAHPPLQEAAAASLPFAAAVREVISRAAQPISAEDDAGSTLRLLAYLQWRLRVGAPAFWAVVARRRGKAAPRAAALMLRHYKRLALESGAVELDARVLWRLAEWTAAPTDDMDVRVWCSCIMS